MTNPRPQNIAASVGRWIPCVLPFSLMLGSATLWFRLQS